MKHYFTAFLFAFGSTAAWAADAPTSFKFQFAPGKVAPGYTQVKPDLVYNATTGYGFETGANITVVDSTAVAQANGTALDGNPLHNGFITSGNLFLFSVAVPEGNYKVTVTLGDANGESTTTVKAESRRLMLERIHTAPAKFETHSLNVIETHSFNVSVRRPVLPDGTKLKLDVQEMDVNTKQLITRTWDDKLTLEFCDTKPAVCAVEIEPAVDPVTVFIIGDSTVTDQWVEPYGTWGQMLARWFKPPVVVANFAESGETLKAFRAEHRWEKILGEIKPGDYVFMQFGTNDLNKTGHNGIWPADDSEGDWAKTYAEGEGYKNLLKQYAAETKAKGGIPVIVSPMTKIDSRTGAINTTGLRNYPKDAMDAAKEAGVASIDLNAMSIQVDQALDLGPQMSQVVYTSEGLHQRTYGGYLFSRCIVEGIKQNKLDLAKYLVDDAGSFDPQHPQPQPADFKVPLEPVPPRVGRGRAGFGPGAGSARGRAGSGRGAATAATAPIQASASASAGSGTPPVSGTGQGN